MMDGPAMGLTSTDVEVDESLWADRSSLEEEGVYGRSLFGLTVRAEPRSRQHVPGLDTAKLALPCSKHDATGYLFNVYFSSSSISVLSFVPLSMHLVPDTVARTFLETTSCWPIHT